MIFLNSFSELYKEEEEDKEGEKEKNKQTSCFGHLCVKTGDGGFLGIFWIFYNWASCN